jgi:hypothetical protein
VDTARPVSSTRRKSGADRSVAARDRTKPTGTSGLAWPGPFAGDGQWWPGLLAFSFGRGIRGSSSDGACLAGTFASRFLLMAGRYSSPRPPEYSLNHSALKRRPFAVGPPLAHTEPSQEFPGVECAVSPRYNLPARQTGSTRRATVPPGIFPDISSPQGPATLERYSEVNGALGIYFFSTSVDYPVENPARAAFPPPRTNLSPRPPHHSQPPEA